MAISKAMRDKVLKRDNGYCYHCGEDETISVNHRMNRGMGGRKSLDRLDNLMVLCSQMNLRIEADSFAATNAITLGWKLPQWADFSTPIYDACTGLWWLLKVDGSRVETDEPSLMF